jgi:hypothetical protein
MSFTLTCGCKVENKSWGIFCEWDTETRECKPAIAYGVLCSKHYMEYEARPTEMFKALHGI